MSVTFLLVAAVSLAYVFARSFVGASLAEVVLSSILFFFFLSTTVYRRSVRTWRDFRYLFDGFFRFFMSVVVAAGIGVMGVVRHDVSPIQALLDALFALVFFAAFASLFSARRTSQGPFN